MVLQTLPPIAPTSGSDSMKSCALASRAACWTSASEAVASPNRMLSATLPLNSTGSWLTWPIWRRNQATPRSWMSTPSTRICKRHDGVIKWKHFPRYWPFVRGIHRSPVNSSHQGQWRGALMFSLICAWINGWIYNRKAGDLRRHRTHYDAIVLEDCCWFSDIDIYMSPESHVSVLLTLNFEIYDVCMSFPKYVHNDRD